MDYKKTGAAKGAKGAPRFDAHKQAPKGTGNREQSEKEVLLARMKAAAEKKKSD